MPRDASTCCLKVRTTVAQGLPRITSYTRTQLRTAGLDKHTRKFPPRPRALLLRSHFKPPVEGWGDVSWVKCLQSKGKDLSSNSQNTYTAGHDSACLQSQHSYKETGDKDRKSACSLSLPPPLPVNHFLCQGSTSKNSHNLPKQYYQLRTKCSNTCTCGGHFTVKHRPRDRKGRSQGTVVSVSLRVMRAGDCDYHTLPPETPGVQESPLLEGICLLPWQPLEFGRSPFPAPSPMD